MVYNILRHACAPLMHGIPSNAGHFLSTFLTKYKQTQVAGYRNFVCPKLAGRVCLCWPPLPLPLPVTHTISTRVTPNCPLQPLHRPPGDSKDRSLGAPLTIKPNCQGPIFDGAAGNVGFSYMAPYACFPSAVPPVGCGLPQATARCSGLAAPQNPLPLHICPFSIRFLVIPTSTFCGRETLEHSTGKWSGVIHGHTTNKCTFFQQHHATPEHNRG